ncbi:MAG: hypothetical protein M1535_04915 [Candidatus Thermoplasmatota archaeon]|jgi:hypothetical protein|nr:hypothetical protein [Candidatus Thermoplasmatota archaeon]
MLAPDHWVPLMVVSKKLGYSTRKSLGSAAGLGALHALTSEALAGIALIVGLFLVKSFLNYLEFASIALLVIVGLYFIVNGYIETNDEEGYSSSSIRSIVSISAFPDFALIPIMLTSSTLPDLSILAVLAAFALISAISLLIMVYITMKGLSKTLEKVPPRYIDYIMGIILFITSAIIAFTIA